MGFALIYRVPFVLILAVLIVALGSMMAGASESMPAAEDELFARLNEERIHADRSALEHDPLLRELARNKAIDMAVNAYFDHISPTLGTVYDMFQRAGISYKWAGENIARASSVDVIHDAFMASPDHRANILSAGYSHVGVGAISYRGKVYVAQMFMRPRV